MSSTVDGLSESSGGGKGIEGVVIQDVLHTSSELSTTSENDISPELEEELLRSPALAITVGKDKEDKNVSSSPEKMLTTPDESTLPTGTVEQEIECINKGGSLCEMPSLGPELTITQVNESLPMIDKKTPLEVSIIKIENHAVINGAAATIQDGVKQANHVNGLVMVNGNKKCTNGSSDCTPSSKSVVLTSEDSTADDSEPVGDAEQHSHPLKCKEIPVMKWGIMNKKQCTTTGAYSRQKKLPMLAPKPAGASSPLQTLSNQDVYLQLLRVPKFIPVTDKGVASPPPSQQQYQDDSSKSIQLPQQQQCQIIGNPCVQQRPTALVNPFPAQKVVKDNSSMVVGAVSKAIQADALDTVAVSTNSVGTLMLNGPVTAAIEWKSKNSLDTSDTDKTNICPVPKVNRQHQRWTQTTLLDFHRIKSVTASSPNVQQQSVTTGVPLQQQLATQQPQQQQQTQAQRNKSVGSSNVGTTMLTSVLTRLQVGGTVCVSGNGGNNATSILIQNKSQQQQSDASILQNLLATQQAAAIAASTSIGEQIGSSVHTMGAVDQQQQIIATTPAEMNVIDRLKRLGTVVELEDDKDLSPSPPDLSASPSASPKVEHTSSNAIALLEGIKIDKPQSPLIKALEDTTATSSHQLNGQNKNCIAPIPTTTFYLSKDISVFPHVSPPVSTHLPVAPAPAQPKRSHLTNSNKSIPSQLSTVPTQPRLPPDVSVFATTRTANNGVESKTVQQWSLTSLVQKVKGSSTSKQATHKILEEINQMNMNKQRARQNHLRNIQPKPQQQLQKQQVLHMQQQQEQPQQSLPELKMPQITNSNQQLLSPKRKNSLTKDVQHNLTTSAINALEPVVDIVEEENVLSSEGTFVFNMDSFFNVDLPNNDMIYSCDICSAVYQHPHRLKKHYLRLHIARKYISKKDMATFNIDPQSECAEQDSEQPLLAGTKMEGNSSSEGGSKLVFRCHTCRKCVATKAELKSHLTDHPPVVDLNKQVVKGIKNYKCDYCGVCFKWKKMFLKHKKNCRIQCVTKGTTFAAPATGPTLTLPSPPPTIPTVTTVASQVTTAKTQTNVPLKIETVPTIVTIPKSVALTSSKSVVSNSSSSSNKNGKSPKKCKQTNGPIRLLYHCLYCNETFHNGNKKRNHTLSYHPYVRKLHPCVFCQRDFISNVTLFTHLIEEHPTVYFGCTICKDRFTNLEELGYHNEKKHKVDDTEKLAFNKRISTIKQDKDYYTCTSCLRMFVIESCYKSHKCTPIEQTKTDNKSEKNASSSNTSTRKESGNTSITSNSSTPGGSSSANSSTSGNTPGNNSDKKDKPVKIRAKKSKNSERDSKTDSRAQPIDPEVAFFSQVSRNVRENLQNHLDGRLVQCGDDSGDDMATNSESKEKEVANKCKTPERTGRSTRSPKQGQKSSTSTPTIDGSSTSGGAIKKGSPRSLGASGGSPGSCQDGKITPKSSSHKPRGSPWEKYSFPKDYDGRCGLTSYIKDISYLDISTQLIMRRNMQILTGDGDEDDLSINGDKGEVPSVLALERMATKCAESFSNDDSTLAGGDDPLNNDGISTAVGELSGEWVRERTYVCQVCGWETYCLWSMEDHKYDVHPSVLCPRLELVGDQRKLAKTIYTRLTDVPAPFLNPNADKKLIFTPQDIACTKCQTKGFPTAHELHVHLLECAGEKVPEWLRCGISGGNGRSQTPRKKKWSRKRRRPRRGLKRNIPSSPQKPNKLRSKPGDTETIQKMIANLPAKRLTRRVIAFDEKDTKSRSQSTVQSPQLQQQTVKCPGIKANGAKCKIAAHNHQHQQQPQQQSGSSGGGSSSSDKTDNSSLSGCGTASSSSSSLSIRQADNIDTSAEGGDVLSSLRMMPVSTPRQELLGTQQILDRVLGVSARIKEEEATLASGVKCTGCGQSYESKTVLRRHHKSCAYFRECGPTSQHQCQTCQKTFDNLVALIEHTCEETPPRLEVEEGSRSSGDSAVATSPQMDSDIPVLSPVLETDNKEPKLTTQNTKDGVKTDKNSISVTNSTSVTGIKENVISFKLKENLENSTKNFTYSSTTIQTLFTCPMNTDPSSPFTAAKSPSTGIPAAATSSSSHYLLPSTQLPMAIKNASLICEKTGINNPDDGIIKRGARPKRKSGEEAALAVFNAMNMGRRSFSNTRIEKNSAPKSRKTKKSADIPKKNADAVEIQAGNETVGKSTPSDVTKSPTKVVSKRRRRGNGRMSSGTKTVSLSNLVTSESAVEVTINKIVVKEEVAETNGKQENVITASLEENNKPRRRRRRRRRTKITSPKQEEKTKSDREINEIAKTSSPVKSTDGETASPDIVIKRKPGRPFGSFTRRSRVSRLPERRSTRGRGKVETTPPTTDDIRICEDDKESNKGAVGVKRAVSMITPNGQLSSTDVETQVVKKRRNRWSNRQTCQANSPDTTTIVVQAEVHPEPSPRKNRKELPSPDVDEHSNVEDKNVVHRQRGSSGRRKRTTTDDFIHPKNFKKLKSEVGVVTSVDEISVLEVEEIVVETVVVDEEMAKVESQTNEEVKDIPFTGSVVAEISVKEEEILELDKTDMNDIKKEMDEITISDVKDELMEVEQEQPEITEEHQQGREEKTEDIEGVKDVDVEKSNETVKATIGVEKEGYTKKFKRKNKKKKVTTTTLPHTQSPQHPALHSIKKVRKISKDDRLKKNIKATTLSIAKLKKKKRILQAKNDKSGMNKKKEVVKVAGFSWEVSELAKSPEKASTCTSSTENNAANNNSMDKCSGISAVAENKEVTIQSTTVCACSNKVSSSSQETPAFTATTATRLIQISEASDVNPAPTTFHYTLTKEDWLSQTTAPLASSVVQAVHPVPLVQQLASSSVSQTLCTLQPASINQQHSQNNLTSLIQQVGATQTTVSVASQPATTTLLSMQQQNVSVSSQMLHAPQVACIQLAQQQSAIMPDLPNVQPTEVTQSVQVVQNSIQTTEVPVLSISHTIGQSSLPQQISHTSICHTVTQKPAQSAQVQQLPPSVSSPQQLHPSCFQPNIQLPSAIPATVTQVMQQPLPCFQSPETSQQSFAHRQQQIHISSVCHQLPTTNQSVVTNQPLSCNNQYDHLTSVGRVTMTTSPNLQQSQSVVICHSSIQQPQVQSSQTALTHPLMKEHPLSTEPRHLQPVAAQPTLIHNQPNFSAITSQTQVVDQQPNFVATSTSIHQQSNTVPLRQTSAVEETSQLNSPEVPQHLTTIPAMKASPLMQDTGTQSDFPLETQQLPPVTSSSSAQTQSPSLGTIIDSVNKLLNDPDLPSSGYSPLSHFSCLSDIHNYCTEDDISVLQHLGDSATEVSIQDISESKPELDLVRLQMPSDMCTETDCWSPNGSDSRSLMDLDNQQPQVQQKQLLGQQDAMSNSITGASSSGNGLLQDPRNRQQFTGLNVKEEGDYLPGSKKARYSSGISSTNSAFTLMEAHQGKEVVCPTCHSHFLGFPALQAHVIKAHSNQQQPSHSGSSTSVAQTGQVTSISKRVGLESSKGNRLVCHICQQILPSHLMTSHHSDQHALDYPSSALADPYQDPACGERLKSKMSSALGDLLDKAFNNLLTKPKQETQLRGNAAEVFTKLCAIRMKDPSFRNRLNGSQLEVLSKLKLGNKNSENNEENSNWKNVPNKSSAGGYPCEICGQKFTLSCAKKKHVSVAHKSLKSAEQDAYSDVDEYENDWRAVPSPGSTNDGTGDSETFQHTCSECGLSFSSLSDIIRHRNEDHGRQDRRSSTEQSGISRPNTPNSAVSTAGSSTPLTNSTATATSTAISLANTLSRLQQRTRSSSVETQSSCGGSSVVTTNSSSNRGGRGASKGRGSGGAGSNSRSVTSQTIAQPQQQQQQQQEDVKSGSDTTTQVTAEPADTDVINKETGVKGKTRRSLNRKVQTNGANSNKKQSGQSDKCNNNNINNGSKQRGSGAGRNGGGGRKGSLQSKNTPIEISAKAGQALRELSLDKSNKAMLRSLNKASNSTEAQQTTNKNNPQLPCAQQLF